MKIVMIHGQNHHGSTWHVSHVLLEKMTCDKKVKEYYLPKDLNHFCCGCYGCIKQRENCPFWKEKSVMMKDILEADLLILTSPNYCMMPSAPLKAFFDLFFTNWMIHRPYQEMFLKKAVVISTSAGASPKKTTKAIAYTLSHWGIPYIIQYGKAIQAMNWEGVSLKTKEKIEKDMTHIASRLLKKQKPHVGIKTKGYFFFARMLQKQNWGSSQEEYQYWKDQGWLDHQRPWEKNNERNKKM